MKTKFEIRQIDAWYYDECWNYNETWHICYFETNAKDEKRAFMNALHKHGIVCKRGKCKIEFDGEFLVLIDRKTEEPLFVAIPIY